ncbi:uncharacterized protein I206_100534 [Kwoniella pini CBS 10737]|uniref:Uncharacterized protein n=1 Tax=Kwoniella pini CBS 10737 TaxID=1296096 RepID=A0A1B9IDD8_9TREE|nr:uncharacterized protein I206_00792 [Kwoniella pini CBS 10737]OCF53487.1 hypothetical protein I206_00792 [Kwoniella pini CBS 10737]
MTNIPFNDARWTTLNKATYEPKISKDGQEISFPTEKETDWWRTPTGIDSASGLVYGFEYKFDPKEGVEISVDVDVQARIQCSISDQAALFLRVDSKTWIKAGLEFDHDQLWAGAVVTSPYSDWNIQPHSPSISRFTITLQDQKLKVYFNDNPMREVNAFGDGKSNSAFIGVMGCSPKSEGAIVTFNNFTVKKGVRD